jgi:hypothetical protein
MKGRGGPRWSNGAAWRSCRKDLRNELACSVCLFTAEAAFERAQDVRNAVGREKRELDPWPDKVPDRHNFCRL